MHLPGQSDDALIRQIRKRKEFTPPRKALSPAAGLESGISLRPIEALHRLSYVTRPRYQDDVLDRYLWWGLLRYLGFFAHDYSRSRSPNLALSAAGRRISGNQRRVTSEEMGIVFGPNSAVQHIGTRRADYLLIGADRRDSSRCVLRVLECKGTKNAGNAVSQLARAVGQLDGVTVGGRVPQGLATAVVTGESRTAYLAVDPGDDDEPSYSVDVESIDRGRSFRLESDRVDVSAAEIANAAVRASWAVLADFGGNLRAIERWAPQVMQSRIERQPRERLTVRYGIDESNDDQLTNGDAGDVLEAQRAFAAASSRAASVGHPNHPRCSPRRPTGRSSPWSAADTFGAAG